MTSSVGSPTPSTCAVLDSPGGPQAFDRILRYILGVADDVSPAQVARLMQREGDDKVGKVVRNMGGNMLAKARAEGQRHMLLRQLRTRFGDLPSEILTRVEQAATQQLQSWGEKILSARSLDEVFTPAATSDQDAQPE